jgi:hypothetical protein
MREKRETTEINPWFPKFNFAILSIRASQDFAVSPAIEER